MPTFHYTAKRGPHDVVEGVIEADNRSGALTHLTELGYVPVRVNEETVSTHGGGRRPTRTVRVGRVSGRHMATFTRQFASLVRSHVPLLRTLQLLEDQARHATLRHVLHEVTEAVRQGQTLSAAFETFPTVFPPLYTSLIHSGEVSGALDAVLERLAEQTEQEEELRANVRSAMAYPIFVGIAGVLTIVFLMTFVLPRFSRLLMGFGDQLPLPTQMLLSLVAWMSSGWFWGIGCGILLLLAVVWRSMGARGRQALDHLVLRLPLWGPLILQLEIARFARSLGLLIHHGVPILQAIDVAIPVVNQRVVRAQLERIPEGLRQGKSLSECFQPLAVGTSLLVNTVAVGEESGLVSEALIQVARYYEQEAQRLLRTLMALLEPTLIVAIGLFVGFIVLSVLLPVFEMSSLVR